MNDPHNTGPDTPQAPQLERELQHERAASELLRHLPLVRAPKSLMTEVLARLAAEQARPWWQRSLRRWPLPAQAFMGVAGLAAVLLASAWFGELLGWATELRYSDVMVTASMRWDAMQDALQVLRLALSAIAGLVPGWLGTWLIAALVASTGFTLAVFFGARRALQVRSQA